MSTFTSRRLPVPGIRFEVQPPPLTDVLPRMDVAVFVGFAASGPLHTPVAVEDVAHFTAIFGSDLPLAWNAERGEIVYAYLASSVRAFFRNGGRRCWIIRVGNARANTFTVPHFKRVQKNPATGAWEFHAVTVRATSEGSWSDTLLVNTTLLSKGITIDTLTLSSNQLSITLTSNVDILEGSLLQVSFADNATPTTPTYILYAVLENVKVTQAKTLANPANSSQQFSAVASNPLLFQAALPTDGSPVLADPLPAQTELDTLTKQAAILTFELWVTSVDGSLARMRDLGFSASHPRFWGALPTDQQIYTGTGVSTIHPYAALWQEALQQHFPLAAQESMEDGFFIPVNMQATLRESEFVGAEQHAPVPLPAPLSSTRPETPLDRDGLAIFDARLFLDPDLQENVTTENLLAQADYISYQGPQLRPLQGMHAALSIDEATIIAIPDAIHAGWTSTYIGGAPADPLPPTPTELTPATATFSNCVVPSRTAAPALQQPELKGTLLRLSWSAVGDKGTSARYTLQEATLPDFADAVTIYTDRIMRQDSDTISWLLYDRSPRDYYYHVNAQLEDGNHTVSDWSNGVVVRIAPASAWQLQQPNQFDPQTLVVIHTALLRLCAARSDIFAVMALPAHYREDDAIAYTAYLKPLTQFDRGQRVGPVQPLTQLDRGKEIDANILGYDEARALSFAALYHPWLIGRENSQLNELRQTPPDGAVAGILARRAIARGGWIAPANEVLGNVVALTPSLARERWLALQEAQLNVIRQEPRGFLSLSADTLSDDSELRPISVRRLLILLRRLALRLGAEYVFEPNNDAFRRAVQRGFEAMLEQLFVRGAFAGNIASEGFQVVTKSYLNTPQSVEQGRFIVEIKIAPSQPLTFLTVRLLQSNEGSLVTEE